LPSPDVLLAEAALFYPAASFDAMRLSD